MKHVIYLFFAILFYGQFSLACGRVSSPKAITLSGASFADKITAQVGSQCDSMRLFVSNRSASGTTATNENSIAHFAIAKGNPICAAKGGGECIDLAKEVIRVDGKTVAIIETTDTAAFLFSVNKNGEKDVTKPYFKFYQSNAKSRFRARGGNENTLGPVAVEAYSNGKQVGEMVVDGGPCGLRGEGLSQRTGELNLNGKKYVAMAGCGGDRLEELPYTDSTSTNSPSNTGTSTKPNAESYGR